jgi:hypothetical protein
VLSRTNGLIVCALVVSAVAVGTSGGRAPVPVETRTYRFKARITDNAGITPFKVKDTISGKFTYDVRSEVVRKGDEWGHFKSKRNAVMFEYGDLSFVGTGDVLVTVSSFKHAEHFSVVAPDLQLPKGWEMDHKLGSQTYSVLVQNAPSQGIIEGTAIPTKLSLSDFRSSADHKSFVEVLLDFGNGVSFPGGAVKGRATVMAVLEDLDEVRP